MIVLNLTPLLNARGIDRPYTYLIKAGFTPFTANKLLSTKVRALNLDHLERLCKALNCEPNDLFLWKPNKDELLSENHPLNKLAKQENFGDWKNTLATLPLDKLKAITDKILQEEEAGRNSKA